jgi:hypothetical protein
LRSGYWLDLKISWDKERYFTITILAIDVEEQHPLMGL